MKAICFILSLYVFFLSTAPGCCDDICKDEIKTEHTEDDSKDHHEDGFNDCSPFLTCGPCSGFVFSTLIFDLKKVRFTKSNFIAVYESQFAEDFFPKIWQPPKIS